MAVQLCVTIIDSAIDAHWHDSLYIHVQLTRQDEEQAREEYAHHQCEEQE